MRMVGRMRSLIGALLILIFLLSTVTAALPSFAEATNDESKATVKARLALIMITNAERLQLRVEAAFNVTTPSADLKAKYDEAVELIVKAKQAYNASDYDAAIQYASQALRLLCSILHTLRHDKVAEARRKAALIAAYTRYREIYERTRLLIERLEGYNVTIPEELLDELDEFGELLDEVKAALNEGNYTKAAELLKEAKGYVRLCARIQAHVRAAIMPRFAERFRERVLAWHRLKNLIRGNEVAFKILIERLNATIERLKIVREHLATETNASPQALAALDLAISRLEETLEQILEARETYHMVLANLTQTDALLKYVKKRGIKVPEDIKELLEEIREDLEEGNLADARLKYKELKEKIREYLLERLFNITSGELYIAAFTYNLTEGRYIPILPHPGMILYVYHDDDLTGKVVVVRLLGPMPKELRHKRPGRGFRWPPPAKTFTVKAVVKLIEGKAEVGDTLRLPPDIVTIPEAVPPEGIIVSKLEQPSGRPSGPSGGKIIKYKGKLTAKDIVSINKATNLALLLHNATIEIKKDDKTVATARIISITLARFDLKSKTAVYEVTIELQQGATLELGQEYEVASLSVSGEIELTLRVEASLGS